MSKAVSALNEARFEGAVSVSEDGLCGMITLRGDLKNTDLGKAVKAAVGLTIPAARAVKTGAKGTVAWMSPDELLLIVDYDKAEALVAKLSKNLDGVHALVVNVSDARAVFTIAGEGCREVIAKGAPADLSKQAFNPGELRRTRLGQVAVAFWMPDQDTIRLICFRSLAEYTFNFLRHAAAKGSLPGFL